MPSTVKSSGSKEPPTEGMPIFPPGSSGDTLEAVQQGLERMGKLEASLSEIRKEIGELREALAGLAGLQELSSQIQDLRDRQAEGSESLARQLEEHHNHIQQLRDRQEDLFRQEQEEKKKGATRVEEIREGILSGLPRIQEELGEIRKRMQDLLTEQVNQAHLLTLLKGEAERNAVAFKGIREQTQELTEEFQGQMKRWEEEAERSETEEARHLNNQGVVLYHRGGPEAAVEYFLKATKLQPVYPEAYNNLGLAYSRMKRSEEAIQAFQQAIQLNPKMAETYNNLGFHYHSNLQYQRAVEMFQKALQQNGDFAEAYTNLGNCFYRLKKHEKAVQAWKRAVEIDPRNQNALRSLRMFDQNVGGNGHGGTPPKESSEKRSRRK